MRLLLVCLAWLLVSPVQGNPERDSQWHGTAYGEVAFLARQDDYFAALTRALMAVERGEVKQHPADLQALMGEMYAAYGMTEAAERALESTLGARVNEAVIRQAWLQLALQYYRQRDYESAWRILEKQMRSPAAAWGERYVSLRALTLMRLGRYKAAAECLDVFAREQTLPPFLRYNRAVSLLKSGRLAQGEAELERIVGLPADQPALEGLKDQARLALASHWLNVDQQKQALTLLSSARLEGPFADEAMLLYSRILLNERQTDRALAVLTRLETRAIHSDAVQQALLVLAQVYEQQGNQKAAKTYFEKALRRFASEEAFLKETQAQIASGEWFADVKGEAVWSNSMEALPVFSTQDLNRFSVFYRWFASAEFQRRWIQYHELRRLQNRLDLWAYKMPALTAMAKDRAQQKAVLLPEARGVQEQLSNQGLPQRFDLLASRFEEAVSRQDLLAFASESEKELWQVQQQAQVTIDQWGRFARPDMGEQLAFYRGLLLWEMQENLVSRQQDRRQQLEEIGVLLDENRALQDRVFLAANQIEQLGEVGQDLVELNARVLELQKQGERLVQRQQLDLQAGASRQVMQLRDKLRQYSAAAHEGLADLVNRSLRATRSSGVSAPAVKTGEEP